RAEHADTAKSGHYPHVTIPPLPRKSRVEGRMIRWLTTTCACLALLFAAGARAQTVQVSGTVVDEAGLGIPGAAVQLASASRRELTTSGQNGAYTFSNVIQGSYQVAILVGFAPAHLRRHSEAHGRL